MLVRRSLSQSVKVTLLNLHFSMLKCSKNRERKHDDASNVRLINDDHVQIYLTSSLPVQDTVP